MSTYDARASLSPRSSLPAVRITSAMPPSPSAARFFCSSTREVTFCFIPSSKPDEPLSPFAPPFALPPAAEYAAPFPAPVVEPLGLSPSSDVPAGRLLDLVSRFVGIVPLLHHPERANATPRIGAEYVVGGSALEARAAHVGNLLGDGDGQLTVGGQRSVIGAGTQDVSAWLGERGPDGQLAILRQRRRNPDRSPWGVGADARVFPRHDLLRGKQHCAFAPIHEPRHVQADILPNGDTGRRLRRAIDRRGRCNR